jgi:hypothetical protein
MYLTARRVLADLACCFTAVTMDDWMAFSLLCVPLREGCVSARRMVCSVRPFAYGRGPLALLTGCSGLVCETVGVVCPCEPEIGESGKQDLCNGGWSKLLLGWFCLDLGGRVLILG